MEAVESPRPRPVHEIRFGAVRAAIWRNGSENGVWYSVTLSRLYKDGEQWRDASSFGRDDLLLVAKAADSAHTWMSEGDER